MKKDDFLDDVLAALRPTPEEKAFIAEIACRIIAEVDATGGVTGMLTGSVARDTWVRGDRDLDIFMLFDPSLPREELESKGLSLGRSIASSFHGTIQEKYAEHPYINSEIDGLDVDLVPCYAVLNAHNIQSAVDRTPFHTRYIKERIAPHIDDVLLLKQFAKKGGIYGSDHMTEGFAGYLCELLVLHYGGFESLIKSAALWRPGTFIDIEGHAAKNFREPLVVIDPVDPNRNVAASLSLARMAEFIELCRGYTSAPSPLYFSASESALFEKSECELHLRMRGTQLISIVFPTPHAIPDIVIPQLRRSQAGIAALLARHEFVVIRSDVCMHEKECMLLFELMTDTLPPLRVHQGPPVWNGDNAEKFFEKYLEGPVFAGPFINNEGRYVVEVERKWQSAVDLLSSEEVLGARLGRDVERILRDGWDVFSEKSCCRDGFETFVAEFLSRNSPLVKIRRRSE